jgi:hypothetical protein
MAYGLNVDGVSFNYGTYSIIASGDVSLGSQTYFYTSGHPDITDYKVVFVPYGVRDTSFNEKRPTWTNYGSLIAIFGISVTTPHKYIVLGR